MWCSLVVAFSTIRCGVGKLSIAMDRASSGLPTQPNWKRPWYLCLFLCTNISTISRNSCSWAAISLSLFSSTTARTRYFFVCTRW
uniref:Putative secreted protein n=1 Tax=Anopheles marajoara TaxID=58244 RepID=A0A2M4CAR4_9DIPT